MKGDSLNLAGFFPAYPKTPHLPYRPNIQAGDVVAGDEEVQFLFTSPTLCVEEKMDGANCGMMVKDGEVVLRNRDHVLKKGYLKDTPAKMQFRPAWNWLHDNRKKFEAVNKACGFTAGIYGEWMWAIHGIVYGSLPQPFIAYDIYDPEAGKCLATERSRLILQDVGFATPPLLQIGAIRSWGLLEALVEEESYFGGDQREGLYIKDSDGTPYVVRRYKMIRPGYTQGCRWDEKELHRQKIGYKTLRRLCARRESDGRKFAGTPLKEGG